MVARCRKAVLQRWSVLSLLALLVAPAASAASRPFSVDDLLATEEIAQVLIDPHENWLVIERRNATGSATQFDLETHDMLRLGRLLVVDLRHPGPARPLIEPRSDTGYMAYGFSPNGSRLAIARLQAHRWELGVVTLATGQTAWLGATPALAGSGRALQWVDENHLVAIVHRGTDLPQLLRAGWQTKTDLPRLWERAALGRTVTATAIGSGRLRGVTATAAPLALVRIDVDTGRQHQIADGAISDFELAPDLRRVAVLTETEIIQARAEDRIGVGTPTRRRRLRIVDLKSARAIQASSLDVATSLLSWSPSAKTVLLYARADADSWSAGKLVTVDAGTGHVVVLTPPDLRPVIVGPPDYPVIVSADWLADAPIVLAKRAAAIGERADWYRLGGERPVALTADLTGAARVLIATAHRSLIVNAGDRLWSVAGNGTAAAIAGSQGVEPLPPGGNDGSSRSAANTRLRGLAVAARTTSGREVVFYDHGRHSVALGAGARIEPLAVAMRRRQVVYQRTDARGVGSLRLAGAGRSDIELVGLNAHLASVEPARVEQIMTRYSTGRTLSSWLYLPATPPPGRLPMVVIPYPDRVYGSTAPHSAEPDQPLSNISIPALVGHGYAVLLPSLPRAAPRGAAPGLASQLLAIVGEVVRRDDIDAGRVALWGHSFGGYAAAVIATQTARFTTIIASGGLYDLVSAYGTFLPPRRLHPEDGLSVPAMTGWSESGQPRLGGAPWSDAATYLVNSPLFAADKIRTPMLLLQGDQDIAALGQAEELFSALYRQNKDAVLVSYWGEGHVVSGPANLRDLYDRVFRWLDGSFGVAGSAPPTSGSAGPVPRPGLDQRGAE